MTQPASSAPNPQHGTRDVPPDDADSLEFDRFARQHDPLDIEAATWVARRHDGLDAREQAELDAWLAADPRHQAAYEDMDGTFGRLRGMPAEHVQSLKAGLPPDKASAGIPASEAGADRAALPGRQAEPSRGQAARIPPRAASPGRRDWLVSMGRLFPQTATAALALGGGWLGWEWWRAGQPVFAQQLATARGRQTQVDLPDGSHLDLDTATQATVRLYRDRREVVLVEGQIMFSVQSDPNRPFHVVAGAVRVTVVGTHFSVRHTQSGLDAGQTRVAVEQGRVRVARLDGKGRGAAASDAGSLADLTRGQAVVADARGGLGPVQSVGPGEIAPWQAGRVNFEATPLYQALAEFGRYGATGVVIRDPAVAALRVGGVSTSTTFPVFCGHCRRSFRCGSCAGTSWLNWSAPGRFDWGNSWKTGKTT